MSSKKFLRLGLFFLGAIILFLPTSCKRSVTRGEVGKSDEKALVTIDEKTFLPSSLTFSEDFQHVAYVIRKDNRQRVVVDGREQRVYDGIMIGTPLFIGTTGRFIYIAKDNAPEGDKEKKGEKWYVVKDKGGEKKYDFILPYSIKISPDSKRIVYAARIGNKQFLVEGGKEYEGGEGIDVKSITFSPDSRRLVFAFRKQSKSYLSDTQAVEGPYSRIDNDSIVFSQDGRHLGYSIFDEERKVYVVLDGQRLGPYNRLVGPESAKRRPDVGPGGARMHRDFKSRAEKGKSNLRFTKQGKLLFFALKKGVIYRVVVDLKSRR